MFREKLDRRKSMSDVGSYSETANRARVRAGLTGNPGRLQGGLKAPSLTFTDGTPPSTAKANQTIDTQADSYVYDAWKGGKRK
jgi:hypothetical protein